MFYVYAIYWANKSNSAVSVMFDAFEDVDSAHLIL